MIYDDDLWRWFMMNRNRWLINDVWWFIVQDRMTKMIKMMIYEDFKRFVRVCLKQGTVTHKVDGAPAFRVETGLAFASRTAWMLGICNRRRQRRRLLCKRWICSFRSERTWRGGRPGVMGVLNSNMGWFCDAKYGIHWYIYIYVNIYIYHFYIYKYIYIAIYIYIKPR